jgi:hypothetical protein
MLIPANDRLRARLNTLAVSVQTKVRPERASKQQAPRVTKEGATMKCGLAHPGDLPPLRRR